MYMKGHPNYGFGTSVTSAMGAGLISLLNDQRLKKGLPSLGWLNPRLY